MIISFDPSKKLLDINNLTRVDKKKKINYINRLN